MVGAARWCTKRTVVVCSRRRTLFDYDKERLVFRLLVPNHLPQVAHVDLLTARQAGIEIVVVISRLAAVLLAGVGGPRSDSFAIVMFRNHFSAC